MIRKSVYAIFVALLAVLSWVGCGGDAVRETGELKWPEITQQTKPWSRWWWPASAASEQDIAALLENMPRSISADWR